LHILSLGLIIGWLLNHGDEKQNGADLKTINVSWCRLTVCFCFDSAPAISTTCQLILIHFNLFWSILIYFDPFQSVWSISISSIYFDPFRFWHRNCQNISIARRLFRSVSIQDQNCQNKASQASCMLSMWSHAHQPFVIPAPSWCMTPWEWWMWDVVDLRSLLMIGKCHWDQVLSRTHNHRVSFDFDVTNKNSHSCILYTLRPSSVTKLSNEHTHIDIKMNVQARTCLSFLPCTWQKVASWQAIANITVDDSITTSRHIPQKAAEQESILNIPFALQSWP
jgi:hypothetical protein